MAGDRTIKNRAGREANVSRLGVVVLALVLAAGAAWVWLGAPTGSAPHDPIDSRDREALEQVLRENDAP